MDEFNHNNRKSPAQAFISGLILCIVFGVLMRFSGIFIFPLIFAGILPAIEGFKRIKFNRNLTDQLPIRRIAPQKKLSPEKQLLKTAKEAQGIVTPAIIALKTDIPLEKATKMLDNMVKKGHAVMDVTDDGRVKYEFPDFK